MDETLPAATRVGRVALRVTDLDPLVDFYGDIVGLTLLNRTDDAATFGVGRTPLIELLADPGASERDDAEAGLFHLALQVPNRSALADALARLRDGWQLTGASDHGVSEALYTRDPEGNGVEVYRDRARDEWPREGDRVAMFTEPLDLDALAADARGNKALPGRTHIGHIHLETVDLGAAREFYVEELGMNVRQKWGREALFLAAGKYHHHVGLNVWNGRSEPAGDGRGLTWWELAVPDAETLNAVERRLAAHDPVREHDVLRVSDSDGIELRVRVERA